MARPAVQWRGPAVPSALPAFLSSSPLVSSRSFGPTTWHDRRAVRVHPGRIESRPLNWGHDISGSSGYPPPEERAGVSARSGRECKPRSLRDRDLAGLPGGERQAWTRSVRYVWYRENGGSGAPDPVAGLVW